MNHVMDRKLEDILPVLGVEKDCILSKMGDYTAAFEVTKPELFTLSAAEYENMHQTLMKAIRVPRLVCWRSISQPPATISTSGAKVCPS